MTHPATPDPDHWGKPLEGWRLRLYTIVFEADTRAGQLFDRALIVMIVLSLVVVAADSVGAQGGRFEVVLKTLEWLFTIAFTIEYVARLCCVRHPLRYATSFFGIVDLLAILPVYLVLVFPEMQSLIAVRVLRLLRVFRIFKLVAYMDEYQSLGRALVGSQRKILVFLSVVMMIVVVMGSVMYVVEGPANGFTSIPTSVYWAITTMTTVGFGDITPKTDLGRLIASMMMLLGWGTLAVPTGIVTAEMTAQRQAIPLTTRTCEACLTEGHRPEARFCFHCGARLARYQHTPPKPPKLSTPEAQPTAPEPPARPG